MSEAPTITIEQYAGVHAACDDWTPERQRNAAVLLGRVNALMTEMQSDGVDFPVNPVTDTHVSGQTFGGFRPQSCRQGAPDSAHKEGQAIDLYDPRGEIDAWLLANADALTRHDLYIEHPSATNGWSHWGTRKPKSGNRIFYP